MIYLESTWTSKPLSEVAEIVTGVTYKKSQSSEKFVEGFTPLLKANNIENNQILFDDFVYVPPDLVKEEKMIQKNDILIAASSGSLSVVGKAAQIRKDWDGSFGAFCKVLRPNTDIVDPRYLSYFFYTEYYRSVISHLAKGANINNINNSHFDELFVPLPPLETQKKIAAVLNKADVLRQKRWQTIEKLDILTQSLFLDMFGDPNINPNDWDQVQLKEVGKLKSGGTPSRSNEEYFTGNINWFTAGELNEMFISESNEKITKEALEDSSAKLFDAGSLLIGMYDTAAFKLSIVEKKSSANQACAGITLNEEKCLAEWLYFNLKLMRDNVLHHRRGIRQKNLNLGFIRNFTIPLPPLEDQIDFITKQQRIWEQKSRAEKQSKKLENLFNSLLQKAFKGELNFNDNEEQLLAAEGNEEYLA